MLCKVEVRERQISGLLVASCVYDHDRVFNYMTVVLFLLGWAESMQYQGNSMMVRHFPPPSVCGSRTFRPGCQLDC